MANAIKRLTGRQPLSYLGGEAVASPLFIRENRNPTSADSKNFNIGTLWIVKTTDYLWMLAELTGNIATWILLYPAAGSGTVTDVTATLPIQITGVSTVTPNVELTHGTLGQLIIGTGAGTAPAWGNITSTGGSVTVTYPGGNINLEAAGGGTVTSVAGVAPINITGVPTVNPTVELTHGTDGQLIIGRTGLAPVWATLGSTTLTITPGAGTLAINSRLNFFTGTDAATVNPDAATGVTRFIGAGGATITKTAANEITITQAGGGGGTVTSVAGVAPINITGVPTVNPTVELTHGTDGQLIIGRTGLAPVWANLTAGNGIQVVNAAGAITLNSLANFVASGGGTATPTALGVLNVSGAGAATVTGAGSTLTITVPAGGAGTVTQVTGTAPINVTPGIAGQATYNVAVTNGTDGQLLIGGGAGPVWNSLTAGTGITITPGVNSITIASSAAAGVNSVTAGENINLTGTAINPVVNLNKYIYWPNTNASGNQGMIRLGSSDVVGNRFMHNYTGTYLGSAAGPTGSSTSYNYNNVGIGAAALGVIAGWSVASSVHDNVAVGYQAMDAYTNTCLYNVAVGASTMGTATGSSSCNTAIGYGALTSLGTFSYYNTVIGYNAGSSYTGNESSNIIIGNTGTLADTHTIRIGTDGSGDNQQNKAFMAGIAGVSVSNALPVYINSSTGQLGTGISNSNLPSFLAIQNTNLANMTGDGSVFWLGYGYPPTLTMTIIFDRGSNLSVVGSPSKLTFTAPTTGTYFLEVQFLATNLINPPAPTTNSDPNIVTSNRTYSLVNSIWEDQVSGLQSYFYNAYCDMDAGDTATFSVYITFNGTKTVGIGATQTFASGFFVR